MYARFWLDLSLSQTASSRRLGDIPLHLGEISQSATENPIERVTPPSGVTIAASALDMQRALDRSRWPPLISGT
jgi:hypothetical protein